MVSEVKLEFPEFITHIQQSKNKWVKIGYNKIYSTPHYTMRAAFVKNLHGYLEKHIPSNLSVATPISTHLEVHAPINYGSCRSLYKKKIGKRVFSWNPPKKGYRPNWDIGNLALCWLKCLDDMLIKKGVIPEDTIEYLVKTTYEWIPVDTIQERKLVYNIKTIKDGI